MLWPPKLTAPSAAVPGPGLSSRSSALYGLWLTCSTSPLSAGRRWTAPAGVPALSGVVEHASQCPCNALLRLDKPGPGTAALGAVNCGGPILVTLSFYLYGDQAAGTVAHETPLWEAWFKKRFPMPTEPGKSE